MSATAQQIAVQQKLILIVDDTPTNLGAISGALKDSYKTKVATNGEKALALAAAEDKPDLILLDVMMPEMDGYEVCSRLKADPTTREIPVIFLTGQISADDETKGFEVGAVDYVHKPFSAAVVKARVRSHILLREARAQLSNQLLAINTELEMARQIQLSILPHAIPKVQGLDIAARYIPMTSVAGDFYDFIVVDEKRIGILVADVSGHGMPAALISSMLKIALSAQSGCAPDPARVLTGLNQALYGKFQGHFVTAAYVLVDTEKGSLRYAGAGHPPLILKDQSAGVTLEFVENGLFLGFFPEAAYTSVEIPFNKGDWAVLYTDGILETTNLTEEQFGIDRFKLFLQSNHDMSAGEFVDRSLDELSRWSDRASGREPEDDLTLLAVHFDGR
jgi:serine phosphatase RsbU (regulator of sigma subunit)